MASDTENALSNVKYSFEFLDVFNYDVIHFYSTFYQTQNLNYRDTLSLTLNKRMNEYRLSGSLLYTSPRSS